jgi:hypothetical protein
MSTAGFVLTCAIEMLGRNEAQLPPIVILDERPADASVHAVGFVRPHEHVIYLIGSSFAFKTAIEAQDNSRACRGLDALRYIASVIIHEKWHLEHGTDEEAAYSAQLTELLRLGSGPGRWPYDTTRKSMSAVMKARSAAQAARGQIALRR